MTTDLFGPGEYSDAFLEFWKVYPRKKDKGAAFKAWLKQKIEWDKGQQNLIINHCQERTQLEAWPDEIRYIKTPAAFINARAFEDEGWKDEAREAAKRKREGGGKPGAHAPAPVKPWREEKLPDMTEVELAVNKATLIYLLRRGLQGRPYRDEEFLAVVLPAKKRFIADRELLFKEGDPDAARYRKILEPISAYYDHARQEQKRHEATSTTSA